MIYSIDDGIELVKQYWAIKGKPKSFGKNAAFNELRRYLQENSIPYSHEEALKWISDNKDSWSKNKFMYCRRAVFELNDMMTTGKIEDGDYIYSHDPFEDLSDYWQKKLNEYIGYLKTVRSVSAIRSQRVHCISFANFLTRTGIKQAEEINGEVISKYHDFAETIGDKYTSIYSVRYFLQFLLSQGLVPCHLPYALTAPVQAKAIGYAIREYTKTDIKTCSVGSAPEMFWKDSALLTSYLANTYNYDKTALRNNFTTFFQMFYVFCAEENILCTRKNVDLWLSLMEGFWKQNQQSNSAKRAFRLLDIYKAKGILTIDDIKEHDADQDAIVHLNPYYRDVMDKFLDYRRLEQVSKGTLRTHKSATISFFLYLQDNGFDDLTLVNYMDIKRYCIWISGKSSNKLNNYAYELRVLLEYLFEKEYTIYDLSRALPTQSIQSRKIVTILSEEEIEKIYKYREKANTPLQYRDSAILMLGLLMGLRRIDIVNLKESDIDWKNKTISITQQKTYRPLVLPLPVSVGNSIYLYKKYGRPKSNSEYIFLSIAAPYEKAHTSACGKAMSRAIPGRGTGFHILRRTFASRLLIVGTDTKKIKESLGQSTMNTVHRYLSVDAKSLKACCLPLERTVIAIETTT